MPPPDSVVKVGAMKRSLLGLSLALAACGSRARAVEDAAATPPALAIAAADAGLGTSDAAGAGAPEPRYDLLLAHGRVIDPATGRDGLFDVAVTAGRIAKIAPEIAPDRATKVIDVTGLVVTPGLVDLHTHVFAGTDKDRYLARTRLAAPVDEIAPRSCTTTVVDAGSAGHRSFATFEREIIARAKTRVLAFVNIVGEGMRGGRFEQDLGDMDAQATAAAIEAHRSVIVGIKVAHYAGPGWEPIDRATAAGRATNVPVMIDFGGHTPELSLEDLLLRKLRPGDIFTHAYADVRGRTAIVDPSGKLRPYVREAHERGIVFDLGYGGKSFVFAQATAAIAQGLPPDTISTDMHRSSLRGSMGDLVAVLSKLERLGISLPDLIRKTTVAPADVIHHPELGRLAEGSEADVAVLGIETGHITFTDTAGAKIEGSRRFTCELTLRAGAIVWDPKARAAKPRD
jgi:dihydroorotase